MRLLVGLKSTSRDSNIPPSQITEKESLIGIPKRGSRPCTFGRSFLSIFPFLRATTFLSVCSGRYRLCRVFRIFVARDIGPSGEPPIVRYSCSLSPSYVRDTPSIIAIPVYPDKTKYPPVTPCIPQARAYVHG